MAPLLLNNLFTAKQNLSTIIDYNILNAPDF